MTRKLLPCLAMICFSLCAFSQSNSARPPADSSQTANHMAAGVVIPAELAKSIDAKKAKPGDKVEARTAMDLLSHGQVVIPHDAKITGHVTDAKAHTKESPDSHVTIAFDTIAMKDGRQLTMQAAIQALARPLQDNAMGASAPMGETGGMPQGGAPTGGGMGGGTTHMPNTSSPYPQGTGGTSSEASTGPTVAPLGATSQGVVGINGLTLALSPQGSVVSSEKDNVRLDRGTQLMLKTQ